MLTGMAQRSIELVGANLLAFQDHDSRELLISGPAGSGKTLANLLKILHFVGEYPGARCLVVRKTRESLTESVLVTWERDILGPDHPVLLTSPNLRRVRQSYRFPNRSEVVVGGMDKPDKVLSSEWDIIYAPEATELDLTAWETLGGRLRANAGPYDQMIADCNPSSPLHWLKKRTEGLSPRCRLYQSRHHENPRYYDWRAGAWTEHGRRYLHRLGQMTGTRRTRFLEGEWAAAEGIIYEFVAKAPESGGHLLPAAWTPPAHWHRLWSIDWGMSSPTVLQMWAVDPARRNDGLKAPMYLYREYFRAGSRPDIVGKWAAKLLELGKEPKPYAIVCDIDVESQDNKATFQKVTGLHLRLADKSDKDRGIPDTQARFDKHTLGRPRIYFHPAALDHEPDRLLESSGAPSSTLAELLEYRWDEDFREDKPQEGNDHGMDAMRYASRHVDRFMSNGGSSGYSGS